MGSLVLQQASVGMNGVAVAAALDRTRALMQQGKLYEATRHVQALIRSAPDRQEAYVVRGQCLLALGLLEEAERDFQWARRLGPADRAIDAQIAKTAMQLQIKREAWRARTRLHGFNVVEYLGVGWEGTVYRCTDATGRHYVVKQFHPHRIDKINKPIDWQRRPVPSFKSQIIRLGRALHGAPHPLFFAYQGLVSNGRLEALYYPYRRLYRIAREQLDDANLRLALVSAALSGQAHLLENMGMLMSDLRAGQFMLDAMGRIRYVDYGASVLPATDFRIVEDRLHVLALIRMLVEVFAWEEWRDFDSPLVVEGEPARLQRHVDRSPGLQRCLREFPALEPLLGRGAVVDGSGFIDPGVYRRAAAALSAPRPIRVLGQSVARDLRRGVRRIRASLR
jgi:hypothetical protein